MITVDYFFYSLIGRDLNFHFRGHELNPKSGPLTYVVNFGHKTIFMAIQHLPQNQ